MQPFHAQHSIPPCSLWTPEISLFGFQTHPIRCRGGAVDMTSSRTTRRSSLSLSPLQKILGLGALGHTALGFLEPIYGVYGRTNPTFPSGD